MTRRVIGDGGDEAGARAREGRKERGEERARTETLIRLASRVAGASREGKETPQRCRRLCVALHAQQETSLYTVYTICMRVCVCA